jgi:Peptidase A4 family
MKKAQQLRRTSQLRVEQLECRLVPTVSLTSSTNWSGYAVTAANGSVTFVSGSWTVPTVSGTGKGITYSSNWVGIDGFGSNSVEQLGTEQDVVNGTPEYSAWYEMYPAYPVTISGTVKPGDTITATVTANSSTSFTLTLSDSSWTTTFSKTLTMPHGYKGALSSAEWIEEAPSSNTGVLPLADFGTASFSNSKATISSTSGNIGSFASVYEINMVTSSGTAKATTSSLDSSSGSSFTVTWKSSGASSGHHGRGGPVDLLSDTAPASSASTSSVLASRAAAVLTTSNATTLSLPTATPLPSSFMAQLVSSTSAPTPTSAATAQRTAVVAGELLPSSGIPTAGVDDPAAVPVTPNQDNSNPGLKPSGARPDGTDGVKPTPSDAAPSAEPGASLSARESDSFFASEGPAKESAGLLSFDAREENVMAAVATSAVMFGVAFGMTRRSTEQERRRALLVQQ